MSHAPAFGSVAVPSFFLTFALIVGCSNGGQAKLSTGPNPTGSSGGFTVASISPASGATGVQAAAVIQITFSSAPDPSSLNNSTILVTSPGYVPGSLGYGAGSSTVSFTPSSPGLVANSTYTVTVSGVKSAAGIAMAAPFTSMFATVTTPQGTGGTGCQWTYPDLPDSPPCTQYMVGLYSSAIQAGGITMDTNGNMTVKFGDVPSFTVPPNADLTVQFCPAYNSNNSASAPACFDVGTVSSDSSGVVDATFKFPQPGSWAGDFQVLNGGTVIVQTAYPPGAVQQETAAMPLVTLLETLQPETTVNATGITNGHPVQDPLKNGAVVYTEKGIVGFPVYDAFPNTAYVAYESVTRDVGGSDTNKVITFTTDAGGDGGLNSDFPSGSTGPFLSVKGGDIFRVEPQDTSHAGWIGGFYVPQ